MTHELDEDAAKVAIRMLPNALTCKLSQLPGHSYGLYRPYMTPLPCTMAPMLKVGKGLEVEKPPLSSKLTSPVLPA
jgi:hypothetical protein